jgi:hypothetical protein
MPGTTYRDLGLSVPVTEAVDPKLWRERYAWGLPVGKDPHDPSDPCRKKLKVLSGSLPDKVIGWHLRAALSELEGKLGLPLACERVLMPEIDTGEVKGVTYDRVMPRMPFTRDQPQNWFRIDLPPGVISIERVRFYFYGALAWELSEAQNNIDQVKLEWGRQGIAHILPLSFQHWIVTQGGAFYSNVWHTINYHRTPLPDAWAVDFTRGPVSRHGGEAGKLEAVLVAWCYARAGKTLLSMSGLAQSQGLTSTSISLDGVSRSLSLQASAIYGLNSALEKALEDSNKSINWKQMRAWKRGIRVKPYGH